MILDLVQIQQFRNLQKISVLPSSGINVIYGENGSGKSSFLEAIHYLGFGRSFRTTVHKSVIQHEAEAFSVFVKGRIENGDEVRLGLQRNRLDFKVSVNGEKTNKLSKMVSEVPVQVFTPQSADLLLGAPGARRKFIDWALFHVEQSFQNCSAQYATVLKHKNALLKKSNDYISLSNANDSAFWDEKLVSLGERITELRLKLLEQLQALFSINLAYFLPEFSFEISYHRGWDRDLSLTDALISKREKDTKFGFVSVGPHKADLKIKANGVDAIECLSRGQLRMLVAALQLSQNQLLMSEKNKHSLFLLDDIGAELDAEKREKFIDKLVEVNSQIFVTAIERQQISFLEKYQNYKVFHVEHGQVIEEK